MAGAPAQATIAADIAAAVVAWAGGAEHRTAVIDGDATLSRGDLLRWTAHAARIFRSLVGEPAQAGPFVCAIVLPRSWAVPFALVAARRAGLAFLLLDAADPPARIACVLAQAAPALVVRFAEAGDAVTLAPPHPLLEHLSVAARDDPRRLPAGAGHVMFTSGSGGEPKGVVLADAPLLATAAAQRALFGADTPSPSLWALSPGFDASLSDLFCGLLSGGPLVVFRPSPTRRRELAACIRRHGITRADLPPSLMRIVPPTTFGLETVVFGGEACDPATAIRWGAAARAFQAYGPTEAAVCATVARAAADWVPGLLGRPLPHQHVLLGCEEGCFAVVADDPWAMADNAAAFNRTRLVAVDDSPTPASVVEGEIWLAGDALALGYLDPRAEDAARFGRVDGQRLYRTGDRARWEDGRLRWIGRVDRQLKLHGRLFAPEAAETAARAAGAEEALCLRWRGGIALALHGCGGVATARRVGDAVAEALGRAHRPRMIVWLRRWPRLANGKTDLAAAIRAAEQLLRVPAA